MKPEQSVSQSEIQRCFLIYTLFNNSRTVIDLFSIKNDYVYFGCTSSNLITIKVF